MINNTGLAAEEVRRRVNEAIGTWEETRASERNDRDWTTWCAVVQPGVHELWEALRHPTARHDMKCRAVVALLAPVGGIAIDTGRNSEKDREHVQRMRSKIFDAVPKGAMTLIHFVIDVARTFARIVRDVYRATGDEELLPHVRSDAYLLVQCMQRMQHVEAAQLLYTEFDMVHDGLEVLLRSDVSDRIKHVAVHAWGAVIMDERNGATPAGAVSALDRLCRCIDAWALPGDTLSRFAMGQLLLTVVQFRDAPLPRFSGVTVRKALAQLARIRIPELAYVLTGCVHATIGATDLDVLLTMRRVAQRARDPRQYLPAINRLVRKARRLARAEKRRHEEDEARLAERWRIVA